MRSLTRTLVACLGLLAFFSGAHAEVDAKRAIRKAAAFVGQGEKAMRAGDNTTAAQKFSQALEAQPGFPQAHLGLGHIAMGRRDLDGAYRHYTAARGGYEQLGDALFDLEVQRHQRAQDDIADLRDQMMAMQSPTVKMDEAALRDRLRALEDAIQKLQAIRPPDKTKKLEPPGDVDFFIGNALFSLGRREEAVKSWESALEKGVNTGMLHNNLAVAYWKLNRLREAQAELRKAEELGTKPNPAFKADLERALREAGIEPSPQARR